jgi:2-dehydro-3-deoxyglucarate aldolase
LINTILKNKLKNNKLTIGSWITIGHPSIAEIFCKSKFDWLVIDMEHNSIDPSMMQTLISVIQANGVAALVRVWMNDEVIIKHALDAGADGIVVPMVNSAQDASKAVAYAKYPPQGIRGVGLSRAQGYGESFEDYHRWLNKSCVVVAQIEHIDGVKNIDSILTTDGIDAVIVGPYDLSGSLGCIGDLENKLVKEALEVIENACLANSTPLGYHIVNPDPSQVKEYVNKGYRFIAYSGDFLLLNAVIKNDLAEIKKIKLL